MIAYVQQIAKDLIPRLRYRGDEEIKSVADRFVVLAEELDRLDPRDFVAAAQFGFVEARLQVRLLAKANQSHWWEQAAGMDRQNERRAPFLVQLEELQKGTHGELVAGRDRTVIEGHIQQSISDVAANAGRCRSELEQAAKVCERLIDVLNHYAGRASLAATRSFVFVQNADIRAIVERDYKELTLVLLPGFAWKSAVIAAGSILEAILYDLLTQDLARMTQAMASPKAPKKKGGAVKDIMTDTAENEWRLIDLINVSVDLALLPQERASTIDISLRDYRNFVHPRKEIKAAHPCTEAEATVAKGVLDGVCNHLT